MPYILINIDLNSSSLMESNFDNLLKEIPFSSKTNNKIGKKISYNLVMIPLIKIGNDVDFSLIELDILSKIRNNTNIVNHISYSIFKFLEPLNKNISTLPIEITLVKILKDDDFNIIYSDGSFKKETSTASFACYILEEKTNPETENSAIDNFTGQNFKYTAISGRIENGTNNVGELSGILNASKNFRDKTYQLIISDSEYSIKAFREWIHNWKNNGFKAYNKKPIANKDLIQQTYTSLTGQGKIVLYKWTKGHANDPYNELCDQLAKKLLE